MDNLILEMKKIKYEKVKYKLTEKYEENLNNIDKIIDVIEKYNFIKDDDTLEQVVFKKYLELENVANVAKFINELGYRVKTNSYIGQRKYVGLDISDILVSDVDVEEDLKEVVQQLHSEHCVAMYKLYR